MIYGKRNIAGIAAAMLLTFALLLTFVSCGAGNTDMALEEGQRVLSKSSFDAVSYAKDGNGDYLTVKIRVAVLSSKNDPMGRAMYIDVLDGEGNVSDSLILDGCGVITAHAGEKGRMPGQLIAVQIKADKNGGFSVSQSAVICNEKDGKLTLSRMNIGGVSGNFNEETDAHEKERFADTVESIAEIVSEGLSPVLVCLDGKAYTEKLSDGKLPEKITDYIKNLDAEEIKKMLS